MFTGYLGAANNYSDSYSCVKCRCDAQNQAIEWRQI